MKRIDVFYGGRQYSIGGRDLDDLKREVAEGITSDVPRWLVINDGEGAHRPAHLLLAPGIDIALIPVPAEDD
ncbi:hypothetical protein ACFC3F_11665 [Microbacterium sp. NPDC055910]|uniref:hypothetical protein n=1 Tax=Microbacterium sp. NPDC055910 TaxID=3345659 RepID=UPI0035E077F6